MSSTPVAAPTGPTPPPMRPPAPLVALARSAYADPARRVTLVAAGLACGLLGAMFVPNILHFVTVWSGDENYGHGFLVPLIALYFANEAARRGPVADRPGEGLGVALIAGAILGRLATVVVPVGFLGDLSILFGLAGIVSLLFGGGALRRYGFALFFLVFMVPLPVALYARIASPLQLGVSQVATALLNASGVPAFCEGNMITLPGDNRMFVAEACSGMRQLTGFLALATAWAYLVPRPPWYRALLVASSTPIAMTANVVRVTLTGAITYRVDARYASGPFHTLEGLLMMGLGLAMLYAGCWVLDRLAGLSTGRPSGLCTAADPSPRPFGCRTPMNPGPTRRVVLCLGLLSVGVASEAALERFNRCERPVLRGKLATIPLVLGHWVGRDEPVDADIIERSQADDWVSRVYEDPARPGRRLSLWINYSRTGLNMRHSPEVCLPSGGWTKLESATKVLEVAGPSGDVVRLTRLGYVRGELVQGVGFWYYIFGEGDIERWVRRLPITGRSSHGRTTRGSGLTIEVFCPGEADPEGESLRDFAAMLAGALGPLLPEDRAEYHVP